MIIPVVVMTMSYPSIAVHHGGYIDGEHQQLVNPFAAHGNL